jgi:hypothetical protein
LTLNQKAFAREYIRDESASSARFTSETTAKTPFLSSLVSGGFADKQTQITLRAIADETYACSQTTIFGVVVRNTPDMYVKTGNWKDDEDFDGWAFCRNDVVSLQHPASAGAQ